MIGTLTIVSEGYLICGNPLQIAVDGYWDNCDIPPRPPKPEPKPKPQPEPESKSLTIGQTFINDIEGSNILMKFRRYSKEIDSGLYKAIKEFYWLQEKRLKKEIIEAERTDK